MPNHITNKLRIVGTNEQVHEVLDFLKIEPIEGRKYSGYGTIDFNKITPMPKWVYGSSPDVTGISTKDEEKWGEENTSLSWARKNWGTKWGPYEQRHEDDTIYFNTAWNGVPDLVRKIAWIFPDVNIEYSYADEDLGSSNCGIYVFKAHEILEETHFESESKEAYELAFELVEHGEIPPYYQFNEETQTYEYVEEYDE